jgi:hypothetical protein
MTTAAGEWIDGKSVHEDRRVAWLLWGLAVLGLPLSGATFAAHFQAAIAAQPGTPMTVGLFFVLELAKVALFSGLAVWAGTKLARAAGIDVPVARALVRGDAAGAFRAVVRALPVGVLLGVISAGPAVALRAAFEGKTIVALVTAPADVGGALAHASGIFYGFGVELWFHWGVLAVASRWLVRATGASAARAFPWANAIAGLAFGVFALVSVYTPHAGEPGAWRYAGEAFAGFGLPSVIQGLAIRQRGLVSAWIASSTALWILIVLGIAFR